jgi:HK97 family phage major capsid protein
MPELQPQTREQIIAELRRIVGPATAQSFDRATEARANSLFRLLDVVSAVDGTTDARSRFGRRIDPAAIAEREQRRHEEIRRDPAAFLFFSANTNAEALVSRAGTKLERNVFRQNGRAVGAVVQMRNYAALAESTLEGGAATVPILFWEEVLSRLKQIDELFLACRFLNTSTGGPLDMPLADDTANDAAVIVENGVVNQANMKFSQLQFGDAPLWSTAQMLVSVQLATDSPVLVSDYLARAFAGRFQRGISKAFITSLLADADEYGSSSTSTVTPDDLFGIMGSLDDAYGIRASWVMNLKTWLAIRKLTTVNHYFVGNIAERDAQGRRYLLDRPVFICPTLDDLGAGNKPILFGDMQRFVARSVGPEQTVNKFVELFMPNHQLGFEGTWKLHGKLAKCSATDAPIKALRMPLS